MLNEEKFSEGSLLNYTFPFRKRCGFAGRKAIVGQWKTSTKENERDSIRLLVDACNTPSAVLYWNDWAQTPFDATVIDSSVARSVSRANDVKLYESECPAAGNI